MNYIYNYFIYHIFIKTHVHADMSLNEITCEYKTNLRKMFTIEKCYKIIKIPMAEIKKKTDEY